MQTCIVHCIYPFTQRWSPRGHGLGLDAPRGQLMVSLALASEVKSLALVLASGKHSSFFEVIAVFLLWTASHWYWRSERTLPAKYLYLQLWRTTSDSSANWATVFRQMHRELCSKSHSLPSCTNSLKTSSALLLHQPQLNACLATVASSWDHRELGWGIGCWQI